MHFFSATPKRVVLRFITVTILLDLNGVHTFSSPNLMHCKFTTPFFGILEIVKCLCKLDSDLILMTLTNEREV
jgi:hypothetical protein